MVTLLVDDETPFAQRWGGWYVTGYHGTENHRGNVHGSELADQLVAGVDGHEEALGTAARAVGAHEERLHVGEQRGQAGVGGDDLVHHLQCRVVLAFAV